MKYLARQPILNRSRELFAYERLFRNGLQNSCEGIDLEAASMGLLSIMDAVLDQPLDSILADLPVRLEIKEALLARTGLYWRLLEIAVAHERADWGKGSALLSETEMKEDRISELYVAAVDWSTALRSNVRAPAEK
jgi:c-di-GMP-related signal transduction protein